MSDNSSAATEQIFTISLGNVGSSVRASVCHACIFLLPSIIPVQCLVRAWRWARRLMHGFRASPLVLNDFHTASFRAVLDLNNISRRALTRLLKTLARSPHTNSAQGTRRTASQSMLQTKRHSRDGKRTMRPCWTSCLPHLAPTSTGRQPWLAKPLRSDALTLQNVSKADRSYA